MHDAIVTWCEREAVLGSSFVNALIATEKAAPTVGSVEAYKQRTVQRRNEIEPAHAMRFPSNHPMKTTQNSHPPYPRLCKIATPDAVVKCASDLGVVVRSENLGVASLALV